MAGDPARVAAKGHGRDHDTVEVTAVNGGSAVAGQLIRSPNADATLVDMVGTTAGGLRTPLYVMAVIAAALVVASELALSLAVGGGPAGVLTGSVASPDLGVPPGLLASNIISAETPPGSGIRYLALVDGLLLFTVLLLGSSVVLSQRVYARAQGVVTLVVAVLWIIVSVLLALTALAKLLLMVGLFVAAPFGTIAYLIVWGSFPVGEAAVLLGLLLLLKLAFVGFLVVSQPRFLRVKGLMALLVASVVLQLVLGLIHGFLPRVVVSIGDELWALVTAVVAVVWAVVMLVMAIPAIVNAVRVSASLVE